MNGSDRKAEEAGDYASKVEAQIAQYALDFDMQRLPAAYDHWSSNYLSPGFNFVYGPLDMSGFFASAFIEGLDKGRPARFLSIGCGDGAVEVGVARRLIEMGCDNFEFVCADLSPALIDRFQSSIGDDLKNHFSLRCVDLNKMDSEIEGHFDGVMASHSLHHMVELERVFHWVRDVLNPGCVFAVNDMIGRNGHMRWPETAQFVQMLWPLLDEKKRYHALLKRVYPIFVDHDCSNEGFEGVRAQDILPLLTSTFHAKRFFASGGVVDPFIDRGFGYGFDMSSDADRSLLDFICKLNDALLDNGQIKPTLMLAHFVKEPVVEKFFRTRSSNACVRDPAHDPAWTKHHPTIGLDA